jgi:hypothetical protein
MRARLLVGLFETLLATKLVLTQREVLLTTESGRSMRDGRENQLLEIAHSCGFIRSNESYYSTRLLQVVLVLV